MQQFAQASVARFLPGPIEEIRAENFLDTAGLDRGELDCLIGGPPCQAFSVYDHQRGLHDAGSAVELDQINHTASMTAALLMDDRAARGRAPCQVGHGRGSGYDTSLWVDECKMSERRQQAVAKFRYLERRALQLQDRLARLETEKGSEFALCIQDSGDRGVWEWTGGTLGVPEDHCLELGEIIAGLRSCLDMCLYEASEEARTLGRVRPSQVGFPCLRRSEDWTDRTLSWLDAEKRERVLAVQRFSDRDHRDVDCVVIGALAAQDKHRSLLELKIAGASRGVVGAVDPAWARDLGLGRRGPDGFYEVSTVHGTPTKMLGRDNVVVEGPLGGLALTGAIPSVRIRYAGDLEMDHEENKQRLGRVTVVESIDQALSEVGETLEALCGGDVRSSGHGVEHRSDLGPEALTAMGAEVAAIYGGVPRRASERPGWRIHLREVREALREERPRLPGRGPLGYQASET